MKPGRNDLCTCGSGEKFKRCCGRPEAGTTVLGSPPVSVIQLSTWLVGGRYAEVESTTRAMLAREPASPILWKLHAAALMRQGRDAFEALTRAAQLQPNDAEVQMQLGHELMDRDQSAAAAEIFRHIIKLQPRSAEACDSLGLALLATGAAAEAAEQHRRALQLEPSRAEIHGNLANALCELGQHEGAIEHYRAMLERRPDLAEAHNNLGNAFLALKRFDEAAASYRHALTLRPDAPGALFNLGNALREGGHPLEALGACERLLAMRPAADVWRLLGHLKSDLGDLDRAVETYRHSLELEPDSEETLLGLGKILRRMGRTADAEPYCLRALELVPASGDALTLLAELRADQSRFEEADALLRRAIVSSPGQPEAWAALALYRNMRDVEPDWLPAVQGLLAGRISPAQAVNLHFALGKYHDDRGEYAQAFDHVRRANEGQRHSGLPYDRARLEQQVDRIIRTFDAGWLAAPHAGAVPTRQPVFIVGMPRSGTSLAEQILAAHPGVYGAGELRFWNMAAARYAAGHRAAASDAHDLTPYAAEYLRLIDGLSGGTSRVVDKMPANFMHLGLIHAALPQARIIHLRRDPRDTCLSVYFQAFAGTHAYAQDLSDIAHYYGQYLRLMRHWQQALGSEVILELDYERLVRDPEAQTRRLLDFVGLPWDGRCLEFHTSTRTVSTASNWQVRQKLNDRGIGRWRHYAAHLDPLGPLREASI